MALRMVMMMVEVMAVRMIMMMVKVMAVRMITMMVKVMTVRMIMMMAGWGILMMGEEVGRVERSERRLGEGRTRYNTLYIICKFHHLHPCRS